MDVRARCEETEGSSRADDVGVGGRLTTQETCRYDTWTSPEKAALMGGRGRFALQTILLDTFLTLEDLRLRSTMLWREKIVRKSHGDVKNRKGSCM